MENFKVGDAVWVDNWLYGHIVELHDDGALVWYDSERTPGGTIFSVYSFLTLAEEDYGQDNHDMLRVRRGTDKILRT